VPSRAPETWECPGSALSEGIACRDYLFGNRFASDDRQ
jgi:hypothetical protein